MAIVVARMIASLEAETTKFHARMTAAEMQIGKWSSATVSGRRSTMILNNSLQQLAFQASGIPGPLGKAASAIGVLGLGSGPVFLAVAALGALALVWKEVDAAATLAADNVTAAADRMRRNLTAAASNAAPDVFRTAIEAKEAELAVLQRSPLGPQRFITAPGQAPLPVGDPASDRQAEIDKLETFIRQLNVSLGAAVRRTGEVDFGDPSVLDIPTNRFLKGRGRAREKGAFFAGKTMLLDEDGLLAEKVPGAGFMMDPLQLLDGKNGKPRTPGRRLGAEFGVMSAMALMQGAESGTAGGMISAAAGPLAMINPLAGAIASGVGGIFSSIFGKSDREREANEQRRHEELKAILHEGPMRVAVMLNAGSEAEGLYDIRTMERLGGEPRLGGL